MSSHAQGMSINTHECGFRSHLLTRDELLSNVRPLAGQVQCQPNRMSYVQSVVLPLSFALMLGCGNGKLSAASINLPVGPLSTHFVTNAAQFKGLSGADYRVGCNFSLNGVVTLV